MITKARHVTRVGKRNQVTIPAAMLRALGVAPGDRVEVTGEDGVLSLKKAEDPVERAYGLLRRPGTTPATIEEMNESAGTAEEEDATKRYVRTLRDG